MQQEIFGFEWTQALGRALDDDEAYRAAGRRWSGGIVLRIADGGPATFLDLDRGVCREARQATEEDLASARIVVEGTVEGWDRVLRDGLDPLLALANRTLTLAKGSLSTLLPHARGARALLAAAARLDPRERSRTGGVREEPAGESPRPADPPERRMVDPSPDSRARTGVPDARSADARRFVTAGARPFRDSQLPMRLWAKAKKLGVWDPADLDFTEDARQWREFTDDERELLLRLTTLFQGGEEAVTLDILPLLEIVADEGRLEEAMYLTSFAFEEAKHVEAFQRFLTAVAPDSGDLSHLQTPSWRRIFADELPAAMGRLRHDRCPDAQARASVTYNVIVEGVLAETGYHAYHAMLDREDLLPGMRGTVQLLKRDESRHIAYGLFLLSRLVAEHGDPVWEAIESQLGRLLEPALSVIEELFDAFETMPFGLRREEFTDYAISQFQHRVGRLERAREAGRLLGEEVA